MTPNDGFHPLNAPDVLDRAAEHSTREPVVLYKHSRTCGLSLRARRRIAQLTEVGDPPVYEVVVQNARAVSDEIAHRLGVRHASPQVIVLHQGRPVFDASHSRVTAEAVRDAIQHLATL